MRDSSLIQNRLRESVKNCGKSQRSIALEVGISEKTISAYMTKNKFPSIETLALLCKAVDVSADYILGLTDKY